MNSLAAIRLNMNPICAAIFLHGALLLSSGSVVSSLAEIPLYTEGGMHVLAPGRHSKKLTTTAMRWMTASCLTPFSQPQVLAAMTPGSMKLLGMACRFGDCKCSHHGQALSMKCKLLQVEVICICLFPDAADRLHRQFAKGRWIFWHTLTFKPSMKT